MAGDAANELRAYLAWLSVARGERAPEVFCYAKLRTGVDCPNKARDGTPWCRIHNPQMASVLAKKQAAGRKRSRARREAEALLDSMGIKHK